jgi:hypothetical protein
MTLEEALKRIKELEKENEALKIGLDIVSRQYMESNSRHLAYAVSQLK